jgi:hypothetical protein
MEIIYTVFAEYGIQVLTWILIAIAMIASRYLLPHIKNVWVVGTINRFGFEIRAAVLAVAQGYVNDIKKAREDGKLTDEEKAEAKRRAIAMAKSYIGPKGLKILARVLGLDNVTDWIADKIEAEVAQLPPPRAQPDSK